MNSSTKVCRHCNQEYPESHFYTGSRQCKKCKVARRRERERTGLRKHVAPEVKARGNRVCNRCRAEKPIADFYGMNAICKSCFGTHYPLNAFRTLTKAKRDRAENREAVLAKQNQKYQKHKAKTGNKRCRSCETEKDIQEFYPGHARCKECFKKEYGPRARELTAQFRANNPRRKAMITRRAWVKSKYGLSWEAYKALEARAGGKCELCGNEVKVPCVDHCHDKGHIRGLICNDCNLGLGYFKDSRALLELAIAYLKRNDLTPRET